MFKKAFTLAEVLITLIITGIVTAVTIPPLIINYEKKQTITKLKKVYSDIQNAVNLSTVENGDLERWVYPQTNSANEHFEFVKTYYLPYFKSAKLYNSAEFKSKYKYKYRTINGKYTDWTPPANLVLYDGTILQFQISPRSYIWIRTDINGQNGPNIIGRDIFVLNAYKNVNFWKSGSPSLNRANDYGCNKDNMNTYAGFSCGAWIEKNNWTIPDDYPW